jgi:iron complex outermembrane recepter protein
MKIPKPLPGIHYAARLFVAMGFALLTIAAPAQEVSTSSVDAELLEEVTVIGITPTHGIGLSKDKIPANVQSATNSDIENSRSMDLTNFLKRNLGSVNINEAQSNTLQPDVQYRGFTASPLLGLPQGIVIYVDGVRVNEPFGDVVNWDLIPQSIIESINLIGGANPLFGQNTLGGALSIQTKNGFNEIGHDIEVSGGAFGRAQVSAQSGANNGTFGYYANVRYLTDSGWRDDSPSEAVNFFSTLSWHTDEATLDLHIAHGDTELVGLGPLPAELLVSDRETFFTATDITGNNSQMVNLEGTYWLGEAMQLSGNVHYRNTDTDSFNSDTSPFTANGGFLEDDAGMQILDQNGNLVADTFDAVNNTSNRAQESFGGSVQSTFLHPVAGRNNQFLVGASWDKGLVEFDSFVELSELLATRYTTVDSGLFVPNDATGLDAMTRTVSAYFTDTLDLTETLALTVSGRYNETRVRNADSIGNNPALNGEHAFTRFNPAVGLTWQATPTLNVYGGYSESSRAPTTLELSCSDPAAPCTLPNSLLADPPLDQVVAHGYEGGLRGTVLDNVGFNLGAFHTTNVSDIVFQTTGGAAANQGFFANVGDTRRVGMELGFTGAHQKLAWFGNYSFVHATFETPFISSSPTHPNAQDFSGDGEPDGVQVEVGDRIPGIPQHNLKIGADYAFTDKFSLGADVLVNSGQFVRGDESNELPQVKGYAIVSVRGRYTFNQHLEAFASIENLFNTEYENFGLLGDPADVFPTFTDVRFFGPGAPIGGWVGMKISY